MEAWPLSLQQKLNVDSFTYQFGETTVRTEMEVGPDKVRSRYTDGVDQISCSINMDYEEFITVRDFFKITLANGSKTFSFLHPLTGASIEVRFASPPNFAPLGGRYYRVSMQWEVMP